MSPQNLSEFLYIESFQFMTHCLLQEVPTFRDFWYQKGITKLGESRNVKLYLVLNPQIGAKKIVKSTFLAIFFTKFQFLKVKMQQLGLF